MVVVAATVEEVVVEVMALDQEVGQAMEVEVEVTKVGVEVVEEVEEEVVVGEEEGQAPVPAQVMVAD